MKNGMTHFSPFMVWDAKYFDNFSWFGNKVNKHLIIVSTDWSSIGKQIVSSLKGFIDCDEFICSWYQLDIAVIIIEITNVFDMSWLGNSCCSPSCWRKSYFYQCNQSIDHIQQKNLKDEMKNKKSYVATLLKMSFECHQCQNMCLHLVRRSHDRLPAST